MSRANLTPAGGLQTGTVNLGATVAAGATGNIAVTFPQAYAAAPNVGVTPNNSRLNAGTTGKSTTGFTLTYANWTAAATAGNASFDWQAAPA